MYKEFMELLNKQPWLNTYYTIKMVLQENGWLDFFDAKGVGFFQVNLDQLLAVPGSTKDAFTMEELAHGVDLCIKAHYEVQNRRYRN